MKNSFYFLNFNCIECIVNNFFCSFLHYSLSLKICQKFITDFTIAIFIRKTKKTNCPNQYVSVTPCYCPIERIVFIDVFINLIYEIHGIINSIAYLSVKIFIYFSVGTQNENLLLVINDQLSEYKPFSC